MIGPADLSIRLRVTAAFAAVMTVLLAGISVALYVAMGSALLDEIDTGLRFRAANLVTLPSRDLPERRVPRVDEEPDESFDELVTRSGAVLRVTPGLPGSTWIASAQLHELRAPLFVTRQLNNVADEARLMAIPLSGARGDEVLIVGATTSDRTDALHLLVVVLLAGGVIAVALASAAGWFTAGLALRPIERIRRQASAITASGLDRRLELPRHRDELRRLTETLNDLLERLDNALAGERTFLERASHELRTPLAALKAELDLAGSRPRSPTELEAAVSSAAEETDRLVRLANDLLLRARSQPELPIHRDDVGLRDLLDGAVGLFRTRARNDGIELSWKAPDVTVRIDRTRMRQALDNLLDNALRHTPGGGHVTVSAGVDGSRKFWLSVADSGPGFEASADGTGSGLGLRIARAVAVGHGGTLDIGRADSGGAVVVLSASLT
jgi:two-component system, OmpR family, sensor kinase